MLLRRVAAERWFEADGIRLAWVAANAVVRLDSAFGRQAVVVPAYWVEDGLAGHPLVAGNGVGVGVAEYVADVQRAADSWRWRVDRKDVVPDRRLVERVRAVGVPLGCPAFFDAVECRLVREVRHRRRRLSRTDAAQDQVSARGAARWKEVEAVAEDKG